jgi:hypothetical protein
VAQPVTILHQGALTEQPFCGHSSGSLTDIADTSFRGTYQASATMRVSVVAATDAIPFVLSTNGIAKIRALSVKAQAGATIKTLLTSAAGVDQAISSTALLIHSPNSGSQITAIKFVGTADLEIVVAGDIS